MEKNIIQVENPQVAAALGDMSQLALEIRLSVPSKEIRIKKANDALEAALEKAHREHAEALAEIDHDHEQFINEKAMRIARIWMNLEDSKG